jgi:hypothetical protein
LFDKTESNEEEIKKLEHESANLQELECQRHREMMEKRDDGEATHDVLCCNNDWDECNRPNGSFKCSGNDSSGGADGTSAPQNERKRNNEMALASDEVKTHIIGC